MTRGIDERSTSPETLSQAVERLEAAGYRGGFRAEAGGLRETSSGALFDADALVVDEVLRFEGISSPDDESAVFALRTPDGRLRGTYSVAYGPAMDPADGEQVRRLQRRAPR